MTDKQWNERSQMSFLHHDAENRLLSLANLVDGKKKELNIDLLAVGSVVYLRPTSLLSTSSLVPPALREQVL